MYQPIEKSQVNNTLKGCYGLCASLLMAALAVPMAVSIIVGLLSANVMVFLISLFCGFIVALIGCVIIGLPVYFYGKAHGLRSYKYYSCAGLISGFCIGFILVLISFFNDGFEDGHFITAALTLIAGATFSAWVAASVFWTLHLRPEVVP